jgi:hypothetical protein
MIPRPPARKNRSRQTAPPSLTERRRGHAEPPKLTDGDAGTPKPRTR